MMYREYLPKQQTLWLLILAVPVLVALDWRVHSETRPLSQGDLIPELPAVLTAVSSPKTQLPPVFANQLVAKTDVTAVVAEGLSADAQLQQQGLLNKLYIGSEVYRLRGIIQRGGATALLQAEDLQGANRRRLELKAGDELAPYQVVEVSNRRILLQQGERQLWLQLFVPQQAAKVTGSQP